MTFLSATRRDRTSSPAETPALGRMQASRLRTGVVALVAAGMVALVGAGSAVAAGDGPRAGYCLDGKFLNLELGQPSADPKYEEAVLAWYIAGRGITCAAPPAGYVAFETAPDELGVPGRLYAYWVPAGSS